MWRSNIHEKEGVVTICGFYIISVHVVESVFRHLNALLDVSIWSSFLWLHLICCLIAILGLLFVHVPFVFFSLSFSLLPE